MVFRLTAVVQSHTSCKIISFSVRYKTVMSLYQTAKCMLVLAFLVQITTHFRIKNWKQTQKQARAVSADPHLEGNQQVRLENGAWFAWVGKVWKQNSGEQWELSWFFVPWESFFECLREVSHIVFFLVYTVSSAISQDMVLSSRHEYVNNTDMFSLYFYLDT